MIETGLTISVYADRDLITARDYHFEVNCGREFSLVYVENGREDKPYISFGSIEEMEAVATAMLKTARLAREMQIE